MNRSTKRLPKIPVQPLDLALANTVAQARRESARRRRLPPDAACVVCGVSNPEALKPPERSALEFNHIPGAAIDPDLGATFCLTHHAIWTASQVDRGVDLTYGTRRTWLELAVILLQETGRYLRQLGERMQAIAAGRAVTLGLLDANCQQWRAQPGVYP